MSFSKVEIVTKGEAPSVQTEVYINGHLIHGVRSYELKHGRGDKLPTLTLDLNALDISVDSPLMKVRQPEGYNVRFEFEDEEIITQRRD